MDQHDIDKDFPAYRYTHRLAIMLECMMLNPEGNWEQAAELLGEYQADIEKWMRKHGDEHVSPLGKD
jgi:hypothetical protein